MQNPILALLLGLVGGVAGALAVNLILTSGDENGGSGPSSVRPESEILARVERLEDLARETAPSAAVLSGRGVSEEQAALLALTPATEAALIERLQPRIEETVEEKWDELVAKEKEADEARRTSKPRVSLEEAAREVGLSAGEEDALRRVYQESEEKVLALLAGPDGDVEEVRRDVKMALEDKEKRPQIMQKYLPRVLPRLGDFMAIQVEREAKVLEAVGPDKAALLDDYDIIEARPFGLGGNMTVEARAER